MDTHDLSFEENNAVIPNNPDVYNSSYVCWDKIPRPLVFATMGELLNALCSRNQFSMGLSSALEGLALSRDPQKCRDTIIQAWNKKLLPSALAASIFGSTTLK